jgi:polysaccharide pyruvyl transferase WcaK-like protein
LGHAVPLFGRILDRLCRPQADELSPAAISAARAECEISAAGPVDAVVDISGFSYGDAWGKSSFAYAWPWIEHCRANNKPYFFLPQAWGPFEEQDVAHWAVKFCQSGALLVSRDDESSRYLAGVQGMGAAPVRQCPDITFCFQGGSASVGASMLKSLGMTGQRPVIGLMPSMRVYERSEGQGAANSYIGCLIALANYCIDILGADLLLMSNEVKAADSGKPDDRFLCGIIEASIQKPAHCFSVRDSCTSETVHAAIGRMELLVASRFHALVFALAQGVPVLALGWSHKYRELLKFFALEDFAVDHDCVEAPAILALIETAWRHRDVHSARIKETLPCLQAQVEALFDEVAAVIRKAQC